MMTYSSKPWYMSKTVWGGLLAVLPSLGIVGVTFDIETGDFNGNLYALWPQVVSIGGGVLSIYGRVMAKKVLK